MDDYPGQTPTPPPPAYQPPVAPPPAYAPPAAAPPAGYAPAPAAAPKKKKTWLWIVIALVVVGLLGCCGVAVLGGFLISGATGPVDTVDKLNQAALDGDSATFEMLFDADSVSLSAYEAFIEYVKTTEDYTSLVDEMGEEEAERILREEVMPPETFVEELSAEFSLENMEEGTVPFPEYTVTSTSVDNDTAEVIIVTIEDGEEVEYVLGMVKETSGDEDIWVIKEIKNIDEMLTEDLGM